MFGVSQCLVNLFVLTNIKSNAKRDKQTKEFKLKETKRRLNSMQITFKDFYGQNIKVHNETASANLRIEVKTTKDLNKVRITKIDDCDLVTDISLSLDKIILLKTFLESVIEEIKNDKEAKKLFSNK